VHARLGLQYDRDGSLAASGVVSEALVEQFLRDDYFAKMPPKSLDRNDFSNFLAGVDRLSDGDAAATLTAMVAGSVACAIQQCPMPPKQVLVTGGGRLNPALMAQLVKALDAAVLPVEAVGLNGDMLEAQAFAYLSVRVARGLSTSAPGTTGVEVPVSGGQLSWP
jgi:anhydro-N-acetylmuramic acid kinase